jgi:glycosyltransferase involved in cell wall biosynthesis
MENKNPLLSVVIPTYNEEKDIEDCLNSLMKQSYKPIEVIIVDDGSTDNTKNIIKKFKKVKLVAGEHKGPGFSRNLGAKISKGKILIFVDADMTFNKDYLTNLSKPIIDNKSIGTEERFQKANNLNNNWSRCWGSYVKGYPKNIKQGNVFRAILKSKFLELGGFDPKYGYADDMTFFFKYNIKSDLADDAECFHKNPQSLKEIYKQSRWIGASLINNYKIFSIPLLNIILTLILFPIGIIIIPLLSLKKMIQYSNYDLFFHYSIFFTVRYYGSLIGIINNIIFNKNTR